MAFHPVRKSLNRSAPSDVPSQRSSSYSHNRDLPSVPATEDVVYSFALRAALLTHLIQPRPRRLQHVPAPASKPPPQRASLSINELVKDFSLIRDSKSTRFPNGFPNELDKRITGVLVGKERLPEYQDALVKRTFAAFLNAFKDPAFRKGVDKDRRVEDLLLIFFSKATSELQKGKSPDDDGWKLMVDRHVALFVRLVSSTLKSNDWARERPELTAKLQTMESKLLAHSQDLADDLQRNGGAGGTTVEVDVPVSYAVKGMPGVLRVAALFGMSYDRVQADVDANKDSWTALAALRDLKLYQTQLSTNSPQVLSQSDFDSQPVYEAWKKSEIHDLSQMMLAIMRVNPELAKTSTGVLPGIPTANLSHIDPALPELTQQSSNASSDSASDAIKRLSISEVVPAGNELEYTFMPMDPRACFLALARMAINKDLLSRAENGLADDGVLSTDSIEVLGEASTRWRLPVTSRRILMLEAVQDVYVQRLIGLETLEKAISFAKEACFEASLFPKKGASEIVPNFMDRTGWTLFDRGLCLRITRQLYTSTLEELLEILKHCYEPKPPSVGPAIYVLEHHIYTEPSFQASSEEIEHFRATVRDALHQAALDAYNLMVHTHVPEDGEKWTFLAVVELGNAVLGLESKIQKRYRKNQEIMGVNPLIVLVDAIVPPYSKDACHITQRIIELAASREEELSIQDGFDLYKQLISIRDFNHSIVSTAKFDFNLESVLSPFIWRWIAAFDEKLIGWVDGAVRQDHFEPRTNPEDESVMVEERHSDSVVDIHRIFTNTVDHLVALHWGDDLQHAKFMTAIARSLGSAVARYCELLELSFMKEMDRPSPEQEAAAVQSRQDKWVQLARETLTTKEKAEPFQFAAESLVKLNDIEYMTLRLDELEKTIDVGVCAEKIRQHEPVVPKKRQNNKFVFTIKIIEAEDLRACDANGFSDPYVVIGDEYQKRLAKTRIIYANLNPRWDETVDISTTGPLHIVATIWDWDSLGDHDCVGRTSLKLDPTHFGDFLPREFWLDLDTQGRLLLRISMEGERDDIEFYFGKAFRTLKRTERDMTRKITDKLSLFIQQSLSRRTLRNVLGQGISLSSVKAFAGGFANNYLAKVQQQLPTAATGPPRAADAASALKPLFIYFDENFAIMKQTLTDAAMISVMTRVWKEALTTIESLLVPALSDKPSLQRPLGQQEVDVVYKWLQMLFEFFNADGDGVPLDVLRSPKYHDLQNLNFFYFETTDNLIRTSENMASATWARSQQTGNGRELNRFSAPSSLAAGAAASGLFGMPSTRRSKTIMMSRNLGTMRKAKENKRKDAQAEPSDDMILRILRMRPEAERYLRDRSRQRERLAAAAAAEQIVKQSILAQRRPVGGIQRRMPSLQ